MPNVPTSTITVLAASPVSKLRTSTPVEAARVSNGSIIPVSVVLLLIMTHSVLFVLAMQYIMVSACRVLLQPIPFNAPYVLE